MVYIELAGVPESLACVRIKPSPADNLATGSVERWNNHTFSNQHFLPSVLTVAVSVNPMLLQGSFVGNNFSCLNHSCSSK